MQTHTQAWSFPLGRLLASALLIVGLTAAVAPGQDRPQSKKRFELGEKGFKKVAEPEPGTPEHGLYQIRRAIADDRPKEAVELADQWIDQHPNHPLLARAYLLRGDARSSMRHFYNALRDYEHLLRKYPESDAFDTALKRELKIAQAFGRGVKRRLWGMRVLPAYGEAEELLIRIQERSPGSDIAERAGIELADFYYRRSEMKNAADAYDLFLQNYPDSQWRQHALQRLILANLATFKGPRFDATGLIEAEERLRDYQQQFPAAAEQIGAEALLTRIDETLADRDFQIAQWYERQDKMVAAKFMYKRMIKDHAGSAAARRALDRLRELDPKMFRAVQEQASAGSKGSDSGTGSDAGRNEGADTEAGGGGEAARPADSDSSEGDAS